MSAPECPERVTLPICCTSISVPRWAMMMSDEPVLAPSTTDVASDEVAFDYIKATDFRVIWVDGAIGGPTAQGHLHVALYAERPAIPRRQVYKLDANTSALGPLVPEKTVGRQAQVREM